MDQVASALGFGITSLRTGLAKVQFQENLRASLEETIELVAGTTNRENRTQQGTSGVLRICASI